MKNKPIFFIAFCATIMVSCGTYYRISTTIERDESATRKAYAWGDSLFMSGDLSHNPYFFNLEGWELERLDSVGSYDYFGKHKSYNAIVSRNAISLDSLSENVLYPDEKRALALPEESLKSKFKWFYTDFIYSAVFRKPDYHVPAPIENYLSEEEQVLWTQGDFTDYSHMNGAELSEMMDGIEEKIIEWYCRNSFLISMAIMDSVSGYEIPDDDIESMYKALKSADKDYIIIEPSKAKNSLDSFYDTGRFSAIYYANQNAIDNEFEKQLWVTDLLDIFILYELDVPGKITATNAPYCVDGNMKWKVNGMRVFLKDYSLSASYRMVNVWAFIISGLIVIATIFLVVSIIIKKTGE